MSLVSCQAKNVGKMAEKRIFYITFFSDNFSYFITQSTPIDVKKYIKNVFFHFFINIIIIFYGTTIMQISALTNADN